MSDNKDQPAFPFESEKVKIFSTGLTKREYFAAMAMQGQLSNPSLDVIDLNSSKCAVIASDAITLADELLKQLELK